MPHGHAHRRGPVFHTDDHRSGGAPHRRGNRQAGAQGKPRQLGDDESHRVDLLQADQPQLHRQRAKPVVPAERVLLDQADLAEAHQVGMRLGWRHVGRARQVLQGHGPPEPRQRLQQLAADFDALDATRAAMAVGIAVALGIGILGKGGGGWRLGGRTGAHGLLELVPVDSTGFHVHEFICY